MESKKKAEKRDSIDWGPWAEDEYHLVTAKDWHEIEQTGKYQCSADKATALLRERDIRTNPR